MEIRREGERKRPSSFWLLFNHVDAWQVALIIAALALLNHDVVNSKSTTLILAIGAGYWLAFALNDYFDAPDDALDAVKARRNFFVAHPASARDLLVSTGLISIGIMVVFAQFGLRGAGWLLISYVAMWAYSAPPLRLKNRPMFDLLMHTFFVQTYPYFLTLTLIQASWTRLDGAMLLILFFASLTVQVEQQLRDFEGDRVNGRNFTIMFGRLNSIRFLKWATLLLIGIAAWVVLDGTIPRFLLPFGLISLPALLHRIIRPNEASRSQRLVIFSTTAGFLYTAVIFIYFLMR